MDKDIDNFENFDNIQNEQNLENFEQDNSAKIEDEFAFLDEENEASPIDMHDVSNDNQTLEISEGEKQAPVVVQDEIFEDASADEANSLITVRPVRFQEFEQLEANRAIKKNLDILQDIQMHVSVELGKSKLSIKEVMEMEKGSIVELDKIAGEQVEIHVNNKLVARGEVIVIEDKFGVRVVSTNLPKPTI